MGRMHAPGKGIGEYNLLRQLQNLAALQRRQLVEVTISFPLFLLLLSSLS